MNDERKMKSRSAELYSGVRPCIVAAHRDAPRAVHDPPLNHSSPRLAHGLDSEDGADQSTVESKVGNPKSKIGALEGLRYP